MNIATSARKRRAVVIGGGFAGMLAARAIAPFYDLTTLIERDSVDGVAGARKGSPQANHAHVLLTRGRLILDGFFPGFSKSLLEQGAVETDWTGDSMRHIGGGVHLLKPCGIKGVQASRYLVENTLRQRVFEYPRIAVKEATDVTNLIIDSESGAIRGVTISARGGEEEIALHADLVVDASGRGSKLPRWLKAAGIQIPAEDRIEVDITYTTQWLRRRGATEEHRKVTLVNGGLRGGVALAQEDDRWVVSLGGYRNAAAAPSVDGMVAFAKTLPASYLADLLSESEPIGEAAVFKFPHNRRAEYGTGADWPSGLLVCGDSLCSFNPLYAQGMTVAAMQAKLLSEVLAETGVDGVTAAYFKRVKAVVAMPWDMVARNDAYLLGKKAGLMGRMVRKYLEQLHVSARTDMHVAIAFLKVTNLMKPASSLFAPAVAWRVLTSPLRALPRS